MAYSGDKKINKSPLSTPFLQLTATYSLLTLLLGFAYISGNLLNLPIEHMTGDPAMVYGAHPFTGLISNVSVLLWSVTASVCLFSYLVLKNRHPSGKLHFLLSSGLITTMLCLDDLFMLHEAVFPWHLRIPQNLVYVGYILAVGGYLTYYAKHIFQSEYILLLVALVFLGLSMAGDLVLPQEGVAYFIEDALKLFGIGTWLLFFVRYSFQQFYVMEDR